MRHARTVFLTGALALAVVSVASSTNHDTPADATPLSQATAAAPIPAAQGGGFYIADTDAHVVRRVDPAGNIATVAGNGTAGVDGDGGPALQAELATPTDAVPTPDGGILIAMGITGGESRVRKVSADGVISTVAGGAADTCPNPDTDTDGCPATQVTLNGVTSAVPRDGGSFLIAEYFGAVREVSAAGIIDRVAGGVVNTAQMCTVAAGRQNDWGDGCPATQARIEGPTSAIPFDIAGAAVDTPGTGFLIGERNGCRVRYVNAAGVIDTVAGLTTPSLDDNCRDQSEAAPPTTGTATSLKLANATDARPTAEAGVFVVTNSLHCTVYKVNMTANTYQTLHQDPDCVGGGGSAYGLTAAIPAPGGRFLIADANSSQIAQAESDGSATNVAGSGQPTHNTSPPVISGTPEEGQTLTCSNGTWDHSPTSFTRQWNRNGLAISGATGSTYTVPAGAAGSSLSCTVTAENSANPAVVESATSAAVAVVAGTLPPDRDGDGIPDAGDACPDQDSRGQDANGDGCIDAVAPAADGDSDGIPDAGDKCPGENASARDADRDGCLDPLPVPCPCPGASLTRLGQLGRWAGSRGWWPCGRR